MTSRLMMILRVAGFHILEDFEFSHYPTKMHLTAFGSNIRLNSSGTCANARESKILRYEMSGLHPFQSSNGVTSLVLEIFQFRSWVALMAASPESSRDTFFPFSILLAASIIGQFIICFVALIIMTLLVHILMDIYFADTKHKDNLSIHITMQSNERRTCVIKITKTTSSITDVRP